MNHHRAGVLPVLLAGLALLLPGLLLAQTQTPSLAPVEGKEIKRIDLDAPASSDVLRVRQTLRLREGDLYRADTVRSDVAALYALGDFTNVEVEAVPDETGVRVVFHLRARARIKAIRFEGRTALDEEKLRDRLRLKVGSSASPFGMKADREAIRSYYLDEGYSFAEIRLETNDVPDGVELVYYIEAGPRTHVESVEFEGNTAVPDSALRNVMIAVKEGNMFTRGKFDPALLRSDLLAVREVFRRKGYLDATVGHEILTDEGKERAHLLVRVREGELYRIQHMTMRGATVYEPSELLSAMSLREGAPFEQDSLHADIEAITKMYGRKGYIRADISVERVFAESEPLVTLNLTVHEGARYLVNKVLIRGNRRTEDHVVRRDVSLLPGEIANIDELEESKRRLGNTGLFFSREAATSEDAVRLQFLDTNEPERADVLVEVTEGGVGDFAVGAGVSSSVGFIGNLRVTYRNFDASDLPRSWRELLRGDAFTGGGQSLTLSLTPGTQYNDYRLSWFNPSVWDSPYSVGFDAYFHEYSWPDYYDDSRMGVAVTVGRKILKDLTVSLTPRVEQIEISRVDDDAPADAEEAEGRHLRNSLALAVAYDKRDNVFLTTSGYKLGASIENAGTVFGGDVDDLRETLEARRWWTVWDQIGWGKHVVCAGAEMGFLQSTVPGDVPIYDRFFIGGLGSLRGFEYRRVGPVDEDSGKQIGGEFKLLANVEYEAPIVKDYLRGVLFVDTGTLESSPQITDLRASFGGGIRVRLPFLGMQKVPLSIYVATPIAKQDADKSELFSFTVGTGFEF